jgi:sulfate adenylyltransferase large subunit
MATGASTANLAIVLMDARNGVLPQSRRHAFIASMLGIQHIVVAVNKMDLVGYSEEVFTSICAEFAAYAPRLQMPDLHFIPISALKGDNVVKKSTNMSWFQGGSLLHYLETVHIGSDLNLKEMRFPVQYVIRPDLNFRGYAGQVASGMIRPGDPVMVLPSGRTSRVKSIVSYDGELSYAFAPMSVVVCLEDEIDIGRGDMLVPISHSPHVARRIDARVVWMSEAPLETGRTYLLRHTTQTVRASVESVRYGINVNSLEKESTSTLKLNDMGAVVIDCQKPLFCDPYKRNRMTGGFILIDPMTNSTVAAGMITGREPSRMVASASTAERSSRGGHRITRMEQQSRSGHRVATWWLDAGAETAFQVEALLFDAGFRVHAVAASDASAYLGTLLRTLNDAGVIAIVYCGDAAARQRACEAVGVDCFLHVGPEVIGISEYLAERVQEFLQREGFVTVLEQPGD